MRIKRYSELRRRSTFEDRFDYLSLKGSVGVSTFGFDRYINQRFYRSREWRHIRADVIVRDGGCDMGVVDYEIHDQILIHHMNPIDKNDISNATDFLLNPEFLISVSQKTHNAIHYGDKSLLPKPFIERRPGDTLLWSSLRRGI